MPEQLLNQSPLPITEIRKRLDPTLEKLLKHFEEKYTAEQMAEVYGLGLAIPFARTRAKDTSPLTISDLLDIHFVMAGPADTLCPERNHKPGQFRDRARAIQGAMFVPPFPEELADHAEKLFSWLKNKTGETSPAEIYRTAARLHYFLYVAHYTVDFNGRNSRLLTDTYLMQKGFRRVSDWEGELKKRVSGQKWAVEADHITSVRMADRLRFNRWDNTFKDVLIPQYGTPRDPNTSVKIGDLGEDWLLPVEIHMLRGGLAQERAYLRRLTENRLDEAIPAQRERVHEMAKLLKEKRQKLDKIEDACPTVLTDCELGRWTQVRPKDSQKHPKWRDFVSPDIL